MREQGGTVSVASEIEEAYAEIGRTVVLTAMRQAQAAADSADGGIETTVAIRLMVDADDAAEMGPTVCCICTRDTEGVWVCAGPCCPTQNPSW